MSHIRPRTLSLLLESWSEWQDLSSRLLPIEFARFLASKRCACVPWSGRPSNSIERLRQAINDVVVQYVTAKLQRGEPVDVAFMAREMSLPLIDMVMEQDEKHQGPLLAQIIGSLGNEYLERREFLQTGRRDN